MIEWLLLPYNPAVFEKQTQHQRKVLKLVIGGARKSIENTERFRPMFGCMTQWE